MKKNILIIVLAVILFGILSFVVWDKVINNSTKKSNNSMQTETSKDKNKDKIEKKDDIEKEIDVNSEVIKSLVYPNVNSSTDYTKQFILKDEVSGNYNMFDKVMSGYRYSDTKVADNIPCKIENNKVILKNSHENDYTCTSYDASKIESNLKKIFGPDVNYNAQTVKQTVCGEPGYYDSENNLYYGTSRGCGWTGPTIKNLSKNYKAIEKGEYLYIYTYSVITYEEPFNGKIYILKNYDEYSSLPSEYEKITAPNYPTLTAAENKFNEMIANNEVNTYIWTFKKQSDGKYYFDSGKWET